MDIEEEVENIAGSEHMTEVTPTSECSVPLTPKRKRISPVPSLEHSPKHLQSPSPLPLSSPSSPCSNSSSSTFCNKLKIRRVYVSDSSEFDNLPKYQVVQSPISQASSPNSSPSHLSLDQEDYPPSPSSKSSSSAFEVIEPVVNMFDEDTLPPLLSESEEKDENINEDDRSCSNSPTTFDDYPFSRTPSPFLTRLEFSTKFSHDNILNSFDCDLNKESDLIMQKRNSAFIASASLALPSKSEFKFYESECRLKIENIRSSNQLFTEIDPIFSNGSDGKREPQTCNDVNLSVEAHHEIISTPVSSIQSLRSPQHCLPPNEEGLPPTAGNDVSNNSTVELIDIDEPCFIDLTTEEIKDNDIEVVANKPPVIFLGLEMSKILPPASKSRSRRNRLRKNCLLKPKITSAQSSGESNETIIIKDGDHPEAPLNLSLGSSESYPIPIVDSPERTIVLQPMQEINSQVDVADRGTLEFLDQAHISLNNYSSFGDLLNNSVIPIDAEASSFADSNNLCTCLTDGDCIFHTSSLPLKKRILSQSSISTAGSSWNGGSSSVTTSQPINSVIGGSNVFSIDDILPRGELHSLAARPGTFSHSSSSMEIDGDFRAPSSSRRMNEISQVTSTADITWFGNALPGSSNASLHSTAQLSNISNNQTSHGLLSSLMQRQIGNPANILKNGSGINSRNDVEMNEDSSSPACPICFETFQCIKEKARMLSSTVCGHIFCTECLEESLKQKKECPTCRKKLYCRNKNRQYHPLYLP